MTKETASKHWRKPVGCQRSGLNHTRTTPPCYNNTTLDNRLYEQHVWTRDVTKFTFEFDNVRTSNVFSRFEIRQFFSRTRRRTSGLHDRHHMSTPTGHRNNQLNKCTLPNNLKGPKIMLVMADRHISKDGPFRIGTYTLFTFGLLRYQISSFFITDMLTYD